MVNVNELKIGDFYKFIIEEVVDEEKKIVDVMEIVGYYTGQVIIEDKQILIVNIPKTIVDSVAYLDTSKVAKAYQYSISGDNVMEYKINDNRLEKLGFGCNVDVKEIQGYIVDYWEKLDDASRSFLLDEVLYVQNTNGLKTLVSHMMDSQKVIDKLAEEKREAEKKNVAEAIGALFGMALVGSALSKIEK